MYNSCVSLSWFSYFTLLLYFNDITLFILHFSFRMTYSRLVKTIIQLYISILKKTMYFVKRLTVNLCNIASVQYNYLSKYHFSKNLFQFHLRCFLSQSLCLSLSRLPNKKIKILTVTSETRKYFIHSNCH